MATERANFVNAHAAPVIVCFFFLNKAKNVFKQVEDKKINETHVYTILNMNSKFGIY